MIDNPHNFRWGRSKRKRPPATETRREVVVRSVVKNANTASRRPKLTLPTADQLLAARKVEDDR